MTGPPRSRRYRVLRALALGALALGSLYTWDGSRQPMSGDGWQLLAAQRTVGEFDTVAVIRDPSDLAAAWEALRLRTAIPDVDFDRWLVVWFVDTGTISCRSRLDGIVFDAGRRVLAGAFSRGLVSGCDDGRVPDSFLVAVERRRMPPVPFTLLLREPLPSDAPNARVEVVADR